MENKENSTESNFDATNEETIYDLIFPKFEIIISRFFSFGFFILWHINLCRLFNAKAILVEN